MSIYDEFDNQQSIADAIKRVLLESDEPKRAVNKALNAITLFEACDWQPRAFEPMAPRLGPHTQGDS